MSTRIEQHLAERFTEDRVVIWRDEKGEYSEDFNALHLEGVKPLRVANNEFGIMHEVISHPDLRYLIYRTGEVTEDSKNWLLPLEATHGIFKADRVSLLTEELGFEDPALCAVVNEHLTFFRSAHRTAALQALLNRNESADEIQAKMCRVVLGAEDHQLREIIWHLLEEHAKDSKAKIDELTRLNLDAFLWQGMASIYRYHNSPPSIADFTLWMFERAYDNFSGRDIDEYRNIRADFNLFMHHDKKVPYMRILSRRTAEILDIEGRIVSLDLDDVAAIDVFEAADQRMVMELAHEITQGTMRSPQVAQLCQQREGSLWYEQFAQNYTAIQAAALLVEELGHVPNAFASATEGLHLYQNRLYRVDQCYRHFIAAYRAADRMQPLEQLKQFIDRQYSNVYMLRLSEAWQQAIDPLDTWAIPGIPSQQQFYATHVEPALKGGRAKAVVIVSDALRFEIAEELSTLIRREDRMEASLDAMLSVLPSYTQLGMAALLPHTSLSLDAEKNRASVDGQLTNGTSARAKVLEAVDGTAVRADDAFRMSQDELRELYRNHNVLYVYHNEIDEQGESGANAAKVFQAADDTMDGLLKLIRKLRNANANTILITADHGFIYQDAELEAPFFINEPPQGDRIIKKDRRYVLGNGLKQSSSYMTFDAAEVGLEGDLEVQIPNSIHRIKAAGTNSQYAHGGASIHEVLVPVITVKVKRQSDVSTVPVALMPETDKITTAQLVVKMLQQAPVSDKVQERTLRAGLYAGDQALSNQPILTFDSTSDDQRDRYQQAVLYLTADADHFNGQMVEVRLEEQHAGTTHWRVVSRSTYTIRRSFTTDFDF